VVFLSSLKCALLPKRRKEPDRRLAERLRMRQNTFLQNLSRARRFMGECLKRRGIDLSLEMS